jgi:hypothetical protein
MSRSFLQYGPAAWQQRELEQLQQVDQDSARRVGQWLSRIGYDMATCRYTFLPRAWCGGCYQGHHRAEPKRFG